METSAWSHVSVLFSEPKIPQSSRNSSTFAGLDVSVLFSEPKIPQWCHDDGVIALALGFSALQRAENSSMRVVSAKNAGCKNGFSALQRAENSSMPYVDEGDGFGVMFQCSSASRKFLNLNVALSVQTPAYAFQCSSASRKFLNGGDALRDRPRPRFQCSSASRKFLNSRVIQYTTQITAVSVLFSEPKIPQSSA